MSKQQLRFGPYVLLTFNCINGNSESFVFVDTFADLLIILVILFNHNMSSATGPFIENPMKNFTRAPDPLRN